MPTTISKLFSTGILQTSVDLDEVTYNSVKLSLLGVFANQFDEINLDSSVAERRKSDGTYQVSGQFDEITLSG
jgi:hypothetical protein